ncbi:hypothetical protein N8622_00905 [bacterium]|nr:hypothetical protein [bacterium]MDA7679799.1 hypothetical protein [bacterium]
MKNKLGLMMVAMVIAGWMQVGLGQSSTYQLIEGNLTWHEAKADAEARGGHLAVITSESEQELVNKLINDVGHVWLGGTDANAEGSWEWVTGENWDFENWQSSEPNNGAVPPGKDSDALDLMGGNTSMFGLWNDTNEAITWIDGYILEIPKVDLENGLVAYYPFNGNANDESGNGNEGEVNGATLAEDRFGGAGKAYSFDGGDYIDIGDKLPDATTVTVSAWINQADGKRAVVFSDSDNQIGNDFILSVSKNAVGIRADKSGALLGAGTIPYHGYTSVGASLTEGSWSMLTWVMKPDKSFIFIDGKLIATVKISGSNVGNHGGIIGGAYSFNFKGSVDDIRIYNRALSEFEVKELYDLEKPLESTYEIVGGSFTWHEAKADAEARGGHLTTITSELEQQHIEQLVKDSSSPSFWLGGTDEETEGKWKWITGETWDFANWNRTEPSNDNGNGHYLNIWNNDYKYFWNDWVANIGMAYILEIPKVNLEEGLVAYYPFNGNANDESGNGNDGTVHGATLDVNRHGESGKAYSFDGENDYITYERIDSNFNQFTITAWAKPKSAGGLRYIIDNGSLENGAGAAFRLELMNEGILYYALGIGDKWEHKPSGYNSGWKLDQWTQFTLSHNGNSCVLYQNGLKISSIENKYNVTLGNGTIFLGKEGFSNSYFFDGSIDDVRIYNRALSELEVKELYDLEKTPESTYEIVEGSFTWHEAKADAEARGGHLATITSELEQNKIWALGAQSEWLGGTDEGSEGNWRWVTGEAWDYTNWDTSLNQPDNNNGKEHYLHFHNGRSFWNDYTIDPLEVIRGYILEIPKVNLERGLVAYYPFNGNANDESGNGNDGEAIIGATLAEDRFGIENKAYYFDGKSYIETSSGSNLPTDGNFTISLWFNFDSPYSNGQGSLLSNQMTDQFQIAFDTWTAENPKLQFYTGGGAPVVNATELQWEDGKWYNIILVRHGDLFKLYRGGIEVYSSTSGKFNGANPEDRKITIGVASRNNLNHPWKGKIDDIRIYDRALSQDEVSALYELEDSKDLTDPPVDPVDPGEPQLATGSATVVNGFMVDLTVDFGGKGYTNPPKVRIVGGGGSGATAKAVVTDGIVIDLIVLTPGIGYSSTPSVEIDMPPFPPKQASATVQVVNGFVVGFEVTDSGRGYIEPPQISILSNTGSGAQAEAILSEGKLAEIKVLNPGIGYSDDATVEVGPPAYPPVRAAGQAEVINGFLVGLEVTDGGRGYGFAPRVKITGGGGSGATAVALVEDGKVFGLSITAAGSGYSSAPEIIIAPPKPEVMIVRGEEGVKVKASSNPGLRCRLEGSRDMITWSKVGNDVVSKSYEVDFKLDATETMHFFRVIWLD